MRFIMALALLWITQLQATPSLLEEAELQAARDPVGYLQRLDASPQQDMELFHARALAQAALGRYQQALLDNACARGLASAQQESQRLLDFRLQQIALTLDTEAPEQALQLLAQLRPAVLGHLQQESEWHALNGLALYRTQQMKEAIAELKTAFQLKQKGPRSNLSTLQCARLMMTLGNLYADLNLHREAEAYYQDALGRMVRLNEPNSQAIIRANMARLYIDMARPDRASELLDALLATPGSRPTIAPSSSATGPWCSTRSETGTRPGRAWRRRRPSMRAGLSPCRLTADRDPGQNPAGTGRPSWPCNY